MANEMYRALNRIKELRIEKGVTQSVVAKAIGISQGMLTNYETGKRSPRDFKVWNDLAKYFGVRPEYVMGTSNLRTHQDEINKVQNYVNNKYGVAIPAKIQKDYNGNDSFIEYDTTAFKVEKTKKLIPELEKMISIIDDYLNGQINIDADDEAEKMKADYFYSDEFKQANAEADSLLIWKNRQKVFKLKKELLEEQINKPEPFFAREDGTTKYDRTLNKMENSFKEFNKNSDDKNSEL